MKTGGGTGLREIRMISASNSSNVAVSSDSFRLRSSSSRDSSERTLAIRVGGVGGGGFVGSCGGEGGGGGWNKEVYEY